jgi:hypothetical protein
VETSYRLALDKHTGGDHVVAHRKRAQRGLHTEPLEVSRNATRPLPYIDEDSCRHAQILRYGESRVCGRMVTKVIQPTLTQLLELSREARKVE